MNLLLGLFVFPFLAALFLLFALFFSATVRARYLKRGVILFASVPLALLLGLRSQLIGASFSYDWIPALGVQFSLSLDPLSYLFLILLSISVLMSLLVVQSKTLKQPVFFYTLVLFLQGLLTGFFLARDLVLFTLFWEAMLLPIYFVIGIWGRDGARKAAQKFLLYMFGGSLFLIVGVLGVYFAAIKLGAPSSFAFSSLAPFAESSPFALGLFFIFVLAFAVKTPLFPFHAWLPESYSKASTSGTILLAAILSKAGIYGFIRVVIAFFPNLYQEWAPVLLAWAIAGVLYGGFAACMQKDFKRLIAYSSFSHVNFILAGLFIWDQTAHTGAILQAFNHGITIAGLFVVAGWLEERLGTSLIGEVRGVAKFLPQLCWLTFIFVLSSVALPGTNSFIGEILVFVGLFNVNPWLTPLLGTTVILSAVYMLRWMQKVYFETSSEPPQKNVDINRRDFLIVSPLVILIFWIGFYPAPFLSLSDSKMWMKPKVEVTHEMVLNEEQKAEVSL